MAASGRSGVRVASRGRSENAEVLRRIIGRIIAVARYGMPMAGPLERDATCREYVLPRLRAAGWTDDQIVRSSFRSPSRAASCPSARSTAARGHFAPTTFCSWTGVPVAVVEAKREYKIPGDGLQQAKHYAQLLDLPFAYSTNGKGIIEDDRDTGMENDSSRTFPSQTSCGRYRAWKGIAEDAGPRRAAAVQPHASQPRRQRQGAPLLPAGRDRPPGRGDPRGQERLLLTMATGTGKTFVAMQIVWKLWKSRWRRRPPAADPLPRRPQHPRRPAAERHFVPAFGEGLSGR